MPICDNPPSIPPPDMPFLYRHLPDGNPVFSRPIDQIQAIYTPQPNLNAGLAKVGRAYIGKLDTTTSGNGLWHLLALETVQEGLDDVHWVSASGDLDGEILDAGGSADFPDSL